MKHNKEHKKLVAIAHQIETLVNDALDIVESIDSETAKSVTSGWYDQILGAIDDDLGVTLSRNYSTIMGTIAELQEMESDDE